MIIIRKFNEGALAQNVDGRYLFKLGKRYSRTFETIKELNDAWVDNTLWSDEDGKQIEAEAEVTRARESQAKLVAKGTVEEAK